MYTSTEHFDDPFQVKKISTIGKAAIASSIFNINEPVMYGLPVVLNPVMMLGYMTVSFVVPTITYIVFKLGLVSIPGSCHDDVLPATAYFHLYGKQRFPWYYSLGGIICTDLFDISSVFQGV